MKFKTATGTNTVKPVKHKWAKVIATVEKHAANKTLRHMHKIELKKFENNTTVNHEELRNNLGPGSWAVRIAYNKHFGGVLIQQQPGEGNRKHYHPVADENWVILKGEWEWWINGQGTKKVKDNDIFVVP